MNKWTDILTASEIAAHHALTAKLDPAFAARSRAFYEGQTVSQLRALVSQAWNCNDAEGYQLARSYAALHQ